MNEPTSASLPSIRRYLLVRAIGIVLVSFLLFGVAAYLIVVKPSEDELARLEMNRAADQVEGNIHALTAQIERLLATAREWGASGRIALHDHDDFARLMIPIMKTRPQVLNILLADQEGRAVFVGRGENGGWLVRIIDPAKLGNRQRWLRFNADGGFSSGDDVTREFNLQTRPWYAGAIALNRDDEIYWTDPYQFDLSGQPGISASTRWKDRNTGMRYVLAFDVLLLDLSRFTSEMRFGETGRGRAAVLTRDGRFLAVPRQQSNTDREVIQRTLKTPREAGYPIYGSGFEHWVASGRPAAQSGFFEAEGDTFIGRFRPYRLQNQELVIGTVVPKSDFALAKPWHVVAIALLVLVVLGLAYAFARQLASRFASTVDSLVAESERIGNLELDKPVQVESRLREFAALVGAQERMRQMLLEAKHGLEARVAERTSQLAERETFSKVLMESASAGLVLTRADGTVHHVSPRWTQIVGYRIEELEGIAAGSLYADPAERQRFLELIEREGEVRNFETQFLRKDGSTFWGLLSSSPVTIGNESMIASWVQDIDEQHKTNEQVRLLAEEQRLVLDNVQAGILFTGDSKMLRANKRFAEIYGFNDPKDVVNLDTRCLFPDEAAFKRFAEDAAPVLGAGETLEIEWLGARRDGSTFLAHTRARPLPVPGYRFATIWIVEDVTATRAAERELKQALDRQNAIFGASPHGIAIYEQRRFVLANPSFLRIFGYAPGELEGQSTRILFANDEDFELAGREMREKTARGEVYFYERRLARKDGSLFWCRVSSAALSGNDGTKGLMALYQDVTEEHEAAEALRRANSEQQAIFESATLGIAFIKNRRIFNCNSRLGELFGYTQTDFLGQTTRIWYPDEAAFAAGGKEVYAQLAAGETHRREQLLQRKDGSQFWCRLVGRAIEPADPSKGSVWMLEDVTEERAAAETLRQAKEIAEEAARSKSMFLANMSHEIRTPMNAIIGMAHLALRTNLDARQRDYVQKVHNAGTSLLGIINDILDFSKIEAGKLDMETAEFALDDVLDDLSTLVGQKASDKGLELLYEVSPEVPPVLMGDSLRVGQILVNLVNNAVKFTETGEIRLRIEQLERTGEKVKLEISVTDSGIGMTREQAARLFTAFQQADGSTTRKYGGTGLGLTICKRLVEMMGGTIWVDSEAGKGSRFAFNAWFGMGAARERRKRAVEDLKALRILVVDDNPSAREVLLTHLANLPRVRVDQAGSAEESLVKVREAAQTDPFDLVLMDWRMGAMDGIEAAGRIKQDATLKTVPAVVIVTAFGREDVREAATGASVDGMLMKPVNASTLFDMIVRLFGPENPDADQAVPAAGSTVNVRGMRVLLAEDNEINQQIAVELMESVGVEVEVANHGAEALARLADNPDGYYDAVFMDLQMPVMDGITATRKIRSDPRYKDLPVVAMTAHAMVEERERCIEAGMNDHVTKPVDPDILYATLARWYKRQPAAAAAPAAGRKPEPAKHSGADVPSVEGLDTVNGLRRVSGNRKLYVKLLRQFAEGQAEAAQRIRAALERSDRAEAERQAHTVKGVAGSIGAGELQGVAGTLESAIHSGKETEAHIAAFAAALSTLVGRLSAALGEAPRDSQAAGALDPAAAAPAAKRIAALLADGDGDAADFIVDNAGVLRPLFRTGRYGIFEKAVNSFDFDAALAELREAAATHNLQIEA